MLKLIHCADVHLGSKMESRLPREKVEERRKEIRATFQKMIEYAHRNGVRAILISGDLFDSDRPLKRDKEFFYNAVKGNSDIDFLYLRGNHDGEESYTEQGLENLKSFSSEWTTYSYGNVDITGLELTAENELSLYSSLELSKDKMNIVMLHGTAGDRSGRGMINVREMKNRNVDYLALGHFHSFEEKPLDTRGRYAYSGCLEGRGFDETGEKGFVLLEIDGGKINSTFVPFAFRTIRELCVDISDCDSSYSAFKKINDECEWSESDMLRVILTGEIGFESDMLAQEIEESLFEKCYFVSAKDKTQKKINAEDYDKDATLRGEFVRTVLSSDAYDDEEKRRIIAYGLRVLEGREAEEL